MKRKIVVLCVVVCLLAVAAVGGTLAYFTDNETAVNTFTMGKVDIELTEDKWVAPDAVYPGIAYEKDPVVTNVGDDSAWIRVDVTLSDAAAFVEAANKHGITDLSKIFGGHDETKWTLAEVVSNTEDDTLTYRYYYNTLLEAEDSTDAIFTSVMIPALFNNADMDAIGENFTITVQAHAMQTADTYNTVQGAFAVYVVE